MPTQRPFLGSFLAAFRAHSQPLPKSTPSASTSAAAAGTVSLWTGTAPHQKSTPSTGPEPQQQQQQQSTSSSPRPITSKPLPHNNTNTTTTNSAPSSTAAQEKQLVASLPPLQHHVSPQTHLARSPPTSPAYPSVQDVRRSRRGSDSSSGSDAGGSREVRSAAGEKWFIGGLTATGEERYYRLSMVRRDPSLDRISTDQMSL